MNYNDFDLMRLLGTKKALELRRKAMENLSKEVYEQDIGRLYGCPMKVVVTFDYREDPLLSVKKMVQSLEAQREDLEKRIYRLRQDYNLY